MFRVIIIGGSITGLTLAHCLELAGIDYILLEKHVDILATVGGSLGLLPNALRIFDQLGLYDKLSAVGCPVNVAHMTYPDGFVFSDSFPAGILKKFGYPLSILTRQELIQVLYEALPDQRKVRTGQRITNIQLHLHGVTVTSDSGTQYQGHLAVGADGVHSTTRTQLWNAANAHDAIPVKEDSSLRVDYSCIFGLASPLPGVCPGEQVVACSDNVNVLVFPGKDAHVGWGLVQKLDRRHTYLEATQFSRESLLAQARQARDIPLYKGIQFRHLQDNTKHCSATMLEEGLFETWHHGRIVCIGDSVSKMTPNMAQGANTAVESAAVLANAIYRISRTENPSVTDIQAELDSTLKEQKKRLRFIHAVSYATTRVHTRQGLVKKFLGRYAYPYTPNSAFHTFSRLIAGAPFLEFVPLPSRSEVPWVQSSERSWLLGRWRVLFVVAISIAIYYMFNA
ncbi:FAD-dependent oxidoreductase [Aspergillus stella-maris]|uniref:FAD-dependent oxidoreductase n=1 Tax=Aspergillus stella-maris TaxID=1810926 RepID=UPI003CCE437B